MFVACAFIFGDLHKKKKEKKCAYHLSQCYITIIYLFRPICGSQDRSGTWLLYVKILSD